jgi:hypothetical protein
VKKINKNKNKKNILVMYAYNPSTQEVEAEIPDWATQ